MLRFAKLDVHFADRNDEISPVENSLYSLRQKIGAIPSIPFITAGTLSRKFAAGAEGVVVDVKWGKGSFIRMLKMPSNSPAPSPVWVVS